MRHSFYPSLRAMLTIFAYQGRSHDYFCQMLGTWERRNANTTLVTTRFVVFQQPFHLALEQAQLESLHPR
jgi:hypothetical protein